MQICSSEEVWWYSRQGGNTKASIPISARILLIAAVPDGFSTGRLYRCIVVLDGLITHHGFDIILKEGVLAGFWLGIR